MSFNVIIRIYSNNNLGINLTVVILIRSLDGNGVTVGHLETNELFTCRKLFAVNNVSGWGRGARGAPFQAV